MNYAEFNGVFKKILRLAEVFLKNCKSPRLRLLPQILRSRDIPPPVASRPPVLHRLLWRNEEKLDVLPRKGNSRGKTWLGDSKFFSLSNGKIMRALKNIQKFLKIKSIEKVSCLAAVRHFAGSVVCLPLLVLLDS